MLKNNLCLERAKEVKVAVIAIQNPGPRISPYFVLGDQPQSLNKASDFNEDMTQACLDYCKDNVRAA